MSLLHGWMEYGTAVAGNYVSEKHYLTGRMKIWATVIVARLDFMPEDTRCLWANSRRSVVKSCEDGVLALARLGEAVARLGRDCTNETATYFSSIQRSSVGGSILWWRCLSYYWWRILLLKVAATKQIIFTSSRVTARSGERLFSPQTPAPTGLSINILNNWKRLKEIEIERNWKKLKERKGKEREEKEEERRWSNMNYLKHMIVFTI